MIKECENKKLNFHRTGTMVSIEGPRFSSRAESKMFQQWGAHTIKYLNKIKIFLFSNIFNIININSMTTCPEVGLAKELAIPYASIAIVTDYDCWRENVDDSEHVGVEAVLAMFRANIEKVTDLILGVIPKIAEKDWRPVWEASRKLVDSSIL